MIAIRKVTSNLKEIEAAHQAQARVAAEDAGEIPELQRTSKVEIPEPIYDCFHWSFKLNNLISFYIEDGDNFEKDIIGNFIYEGIVRLKYDERLHDMFNMYLSLTL